MNCKQGDFAMIVAPNCGKYIGVVVKCLEHIMRPILPYPNELIDMEEGYWLTDKMFNNYNEQSKTVIAMPFLPDCYLMSLSGGDFSGDYTKEEKKTNG